MSLNSFKEYSLSFLSLFGSAGTLICCALPALFVSLGAGATLASLVSDYPQLIWLSKHKVYLFIVSGLLLVVTFFIRRSAKTLACPNDPKLAAACGRARKISGIIYWASVAIYLIGFYFAFIAQYFV